MPARDNEPKQLQICQICDGGKFTCFWICCRQNVRVPKLECQRRIVGLVWAVSRLPGSSQGEFMISGIHVEKMRIFLHPHSSMICLFLPFLLKCACQEWRNFQMCKVTWGWLVAGKKSELKSRLIFGLYTPVAWLWRKCTSHRLLRAGSRIWSNGATSSKAPTHTHKKKLKSTHAYTQENTTACWRKFVHKMCICTSSRGGFQSPSELFTLSCLSWGKLRCIQLRQESCVVRMVPCFSLYTIVKTRWSHFCQSVMNLPSAPFSTICVSKVVYHAIKQQKKKKTRKNLSLLF